MKKLVLVLLTLTYCLVATYVFKMQYNQILLGYIFGASWVLIQFLWCES